MAKSKDSSYLKLEKRIAADERGGIMHRWRYGRDLLQARAGRQRLPKGFIGDRVAEAQRIGLKGISEREIQYRIACAEAYPTEAHSRTAVRLYGSWTALREAGFPAVEVDESDATEDLEEVGIATATQDPLFELPGFKSVLRINGRKRDLVDITVREAIGYRDMCEGMHASFGRTVDQVRTTVSTMIAGAGGDLDANALEAWKRGAES